MSRRVVYGVITAGYDVPLPPRCREQDLDYVMFTDAPPRWRSGWNIEPLPDEARRLPPILANRWGKFFAHKLFPDHDQSLYLDGNLRVLGPLALLFDDFDASGAAIGLTQHPHRQTLDEEVAACHWRKKFSEEDLARLEPQMTRYRSSGFDFNGSLTENGAILRNHRHAALAPAMELWWHEFTQGARRDQLSLPWVRLSTGLPSWFWPNYRQPNPWLLGPFTHKPNMDWYDALTYVAKTRRSDSMARELAYLALRLPQRLAERTGLRRV